MASEKSAELRAISAIFPDELLWENFPNEWVELSDILAKVPIYRARFEFIERLLEIPSLPQKNRLAEKRLLVTETEVGSVVDALDLDPGARDELIEIGYALAGWQLTRAHQLRLGQHREHVARQLQKASKAAKELAELLADLPAEVADVLAARLPGATPDTYVGLERDAHNLTVVLDEITPGLVRKGAGVRKSTVLQITVSHLYDAVERLAGIAVKTKKDVGDDNPRLSGPGGEFVRAFFQLVDSHVGEAALVRLVRGRSKAKGVRNSR